MKQMLRVVLGAALALIAICSCSTPVAAMSSGRLAAASCAMQLSSANYGHEPNTDVARIDSCLRQGGFSRSIPWGAPDAMAQQLAAYCDIIATSNSGLPPGLAPGDLFLYTDNGDNGDGEKNVHLVAIYVGDKMLVGWSQRRAAFVERPVAELMHGNPASSELDANSAAMQVLRVKNADWPGSADVGWGPGSITLADPATMAQQLQWLAENPVDVDQSSAHIVFKDLFTLAAGVGTALQFVVHLLVQGLGIIMGNALEMVGVPRSVVIGIGIFLSRKFDGTCINHALTMAVLALSPAFGLAVLLLSQPWSKSIPVIGGWANELAGGIWTVASFAVFIVTGIGVGQTSLISVGVDLASLPFLWLKPLGLLAEGSRLAQLTTRVGMRAHQLADITDVAADTIALRPTVLIENYRLIGDATQRLHEGASLVGLAERPVGIVPRLLNLATLPLRPWGVLNEVIAQINYSFTWMIKAFGVGAKWRRLSHYFDLLHIAGDSVHTHGGINTLSNALSGQSPPTVKLPQFTIAHELPGLPPG